MQDQMIVEQFLCRKDNIAILIHNEKNSDSFAIDAPDGALILKKLKEKNRILKKVFVTHHHEDHIEGIPFLKEQTNAHILGPEDKKMGGALFDSYVKEGETLQIEGDSIQILATPGHTLSCISYYFPAHKWVFTGDALFSLGCGRIFEGTAPMMFASLQKLAQLPKDIQLYCGHEYSENNGLFACSMDSENKILQNYVMEIMNKRQNGEITLPSTIGLELKTNPFLRCDTMQIRKKLGLLSASDEEVFTKLRNLKDNF